MKLLFDTHALAWWMNGDDRLGHRVTEHVLLEENEVFVSAVTAFEMSTKYRIGKWPDIGPLVQEFEPAVAAEGFKLLPIAVHHALMAGNFKDRHRDPFDRLIAAQGIVENCAVITGDPAIRILGAQVVW